MSRDAITDPEILADQHARARYGGAHRDEGDGYAPARARPPAIVAGWACRARCGRFVPVDQGAIAAREDANALMRRRGEPELGVHEIVFCPACKAGSAPDRAAALRRQSDLIAGAVRELKTLVDNDLRERSLVARLRELGHPDVGALLRSVRASRAGATTTAHKRRTT